MRFNKNCFRLLAGMLALLLLVTSVPGVAPPKAQAKSSSEWKAELDKLKEEREAIKEELSAIKGDISSNMSQIEKMVAEKNAIDQEIAILNEDIRLIGQQVTAFGLLIADKQEELDEAQLRLDQLTAENKERIRSMEENGGLSYWSVLFKANSFSDLLDRLNMVEEIAAADRRRLQELRDARAAVAAAQAELAAQRDQLNASRSELEQSQNLLATKRAEADRKLQQLNAMNEEYQDLLDEAEKAHNELAAEIAKAEKEYNEAKRLESLPPINPSTGRPPDTVTNGIRWAMPCAYRYLSSPWGYRIHPIYGDRRFHDGVDLAGASGTPLYATRAGTVTIAQYSSSAGWYVAVNHGDGFSSTYMHMTHFVVSKGQKVAQGQLLGYMGSTGASTGPHLHFSISYHGASQNPAWHIKFY